MIHPKILEIINFNTVVCIIAILQYGLFFIQPKHAYRSAGGSRRWKHAKSRLFAQTKVYLIYHISDFRWGTGPKN
jgi:hypothetical protein